MSCYRAVVKMMKVVSDGNGCERDQNKIGCEDSCNVDDRGLSSRLL